MLNKPRREHGLKERREGRHDNDNKTRSRFFINSPLIFAAKNNSSISLESYAPVRRPASVKFSLRPAGVHQKGQRGNRMWRRRRGGGREGMVYAGMPNLGPPRFAGRIANVPVRTLTRALKYPAAITAPFVGLKLAPCRSARAGADVIARACTCGAG